MNEEEARASTAWHYKTPYHFYDTISDPDDLAELLDPERRQDTLTTARSTWAWG
jgi:hypothetical protein